MIRENREFTRQQDQIIQNLYEEKGIKKWGVIARILTEDHHFPRNAKQCRDQYQICDRSYQKKLEPELRTEWSKEEQQRLYELHQGLGNRWATIAHNFSGKNDNCVKNHFYSKLRKSLRHLNKTIQRTFKKQFRPLTIGSIYKIIEALEDRFHENTAIDQYTLQKCLDLKRQLLIYANEDENADFDTEKEKELISDIIDFSKHYKRKAKKGRRNSSSELQILRIKQLQGLKNHELEHESHPVIFQSSAEAQMPQKRTVAKKSKFHEHLLEDFQKEKEVIRGLSNPNSSLKIGQFLGEIHESREIEPQKKVPQMMVIDEAHQPDSHIQEESYLNVEKILRQRSVIEQDLFTPEKHSKQNPLPHNREMSVVSDRSFHDMLIFSDEDSRIGGGFCRLPGQNSSEEQFGLFKKNKKYK